MTKQPDPLGALAIVLAFLVAILVLFALVRIRLALLIERLPVTFGWRHIGYVAAAVLVLAVICIAIVWLSEG